MQSGVITAFDVDSVVFIVAVWSWQFIAVKVISVCKMLFIGMFCCLGNGDTSWICCREVIWNLCAFEVEGVLSSRSRADDC